MKSLDVSCKLNAVFQPKPSCDQSNERGSSRSGESIASRIAQLPNGWVSRSARLNTHSRIMGDSQRR
ncbi:hypothetical protein DPMN_055078 [Dreissena polymorpha]|uniref:Uncharacterized protein n=1 Tax=Dreissena polymorpha TaxID=45954 RepID=A0A9D4HS73_DREPO|nr:hypothetical protein DPMN_055078 [Dreissena polymorpha]